VALPSAPSSNDRSLGGIVIRLSIYAHLLLLLMGLHLLLLNGPARPPPHGVAPPPRRPPLPMDMK
jgi:hypothetical protein